jgi:hypothetical protein
VCVVAEAYRRAAKAKQILPRQMQSATWEAVRALMSPEAKRDKKLRGDIDAIWQQHDRGELNTEEARNAIFKRINPSGHLKPPGWAARKESEPRGA